MSMIKLTGLPNPDLNGGKSSPVFVDASRVVYIERSATSFSKEGAQEAYRQARVCLYDEVNRVMETMKRIKFEPENETDMANWVQIRDIAQSLSIAYNMTNTGEGNFYHPRIECTTIGIAYGDGSGNKLAHFHVMESPEEVAAIMAGVS